MNNKNFFISTAIDYPSGRPHLGHAYERIIADVIARYKRLMGFSVHFSIGLDEHGLKIQRIAETQGKEPQQYVDEMADYFRKLSRVLNISYNDFIRTTEERHSRAVYVLFDKIHKKGDIYKGIYKGFYCVQCETFYLKKDLDNGNCRVHKQLAELVEEETYFFRMSRYREALLRHVQDNPDFIIPISKKNEILMRLQDPLEDLSISRSSFSWGISIPINKKHVFFVWVDALTNYLTTIGYPDEKFQKFWPADLHIIGKDIIWHHAVIWGSLLLSAGLPLPKTIFVHGFISVEGQKMSKSLGNVIDPFELVKKYGTDPVRYYLLREISSTEDGDFNQRAFEAHYNGDLANGLGNLVARVLTLATRLNSKLKTQNPKLVSNTKLQDAINTTWKEYKNAFETYRFNDALGSVWGLIGFCNEYINREKPWEEKDTSPQTIGNLLLAIGNIAWLLKPFLPGTAQKIFAQLGIDPESAISWEEQGFQIKKGEALFPRL